MDNDHDNENENEQMDEPYENPDTGALQTAQEAEKYYSEFQKTMNNILQKKKSKLLSPAEITQRNLQETLRE